MLADSQSTHVEGFGLGTLAPFVKIVSCLVEESGGFGKCEGPSVNEVSTDLGMWQTALRTPPCGKCAVGEGTIDCTHDTLRPEALCRFIHLVFEDRLHQTMDGEG